MACGSCGRKPKPNLPKQNNTTNIKKAPRVIIGSTCPVCGWKIIKSSSIDAKTGKLIERSSCTNAKCRNHV